MAYRSDLEAALARLDAMQSDRRCPSCARRSHRRRRIVAFVSDLLHATLIMLGLLGVLLLALFAYLAIAWDFSRGFG